MEVILTGRGFGIIPDDAIGIGATRNEDPVQFVSSTNEALLMTIAEKNENRMQMTQAAQYTHNLPVYLGAIVSPDRQTVYWVNRTRPLS